MTWPARPASPSSTWSAASTSAYGLPIHQFLKRVRIARALALLRQGERPASVARAVGFADQPHLTRVFRSELGFTPRQYWAAARRTSWARAKRGNPATSTVVQPPLAVSGARSDGGGRVRRGGRGVRLDRLVDAAVARARWAAGSMASGVTEVLPEVQRPEMLLADLSAAEARLAVLLALAAFALALRAGPEHPAQGKAQAQPKEQFQHRTPQQAQRHGAGWLSRPAAPRKASPTTWSARR